MKSDVGWGGEKFGGLCPEATPKLTSLLLLACSNSGQQPSCQRPFCLAQIYSKNVLEILGNHCLPWPHSLSKQKLSWFLMGYLGEILILLKGLWDADMGGALGQHEEIPTDLLRGR